MTKGNFANINKTVASLLKNLSARNRDILSRRFGLKSGKKETLESIGASYGITRERVRQIEEAALQQLRKGESNGEVAKYIIGARDILSDCGGIMREEDLFTLATGSDKQSSSNAALVFMLTLSNELVRFSENDRFHSFWALSEDYLKGFKDITDGIITRLAKENRVMTKDEFYSLIKEGDISGFDGRQLNSKHLDISLAVSKDLGQNIFSEVGLVLWPDIKPKGVRDKAYLVLKKEKTPKHFTEIAKLINTAAFDKRKANVQTVHNELIKDARFVLVGRGTYALSEWGYKAGTVKDVLVDILKNSSRPIPKSQLIAKVKDHRLVKENTILLNLQDSRVFRKLEDGTYTLKEV